MLKKSTAYITPEMLVMDKIVYEVFLCCGDSNQNFTKGKTRKKLRQIIKMKIFNFKSKDSRFNRQDKTGQSIFYPWACPGEAYYLTKKQNKIITFLGIFISVLFLVIVFGSMFAHSTKKINMETMDIVINVGGMMMPIFYVFIVYIISHFSKSYLEPKQSRESKSVRYFLLVFIIPVLMMWDIYPKDKIHTLDKFIVGFNAVYIIFWIFFIKKIHKTKGYIFNK